MTYSINDILYTRDGRKSGNLTIIAVDEAYDTKTHLYGSVLRLTAISDYGNIIHLYPDISTTFHKQYFKTLGKANSTHKYYNYYLNHPEALL